MVEDFWDTHGCEYVDLILTGALPDDFEPSFLWRLRTHAGNCISCQKRHPSALTFLSHEIRQLETSLALDLEAIRGEYLAEASAIGRQAIMSRPSGAIFPLDDILVDHTDPAMDPEGSAPGRDTSLKLITNLAKAGRSVKTVFTTVHGEGLAYFNVVVNLNDSDQELAWNECAGLVRLLSKELQEFVFSAALAVELLSDLAWDPEPKVPTGVNLGILYKAIQAASVRYVGNYLVETAQDSVPIRERDSYSRGLIRRPPTQLQHTGQKTQEPMEEGPQRIEDLLQGQTAMMGSMTELEKAARELLDISRKSPDAIKNACEATLRSAIGSQYDELAESTRKFLLKAEYEYIQSPTDLDFSSVIVNLTKAFEVEFRRAIAPFLVDLQQIAIRDEFIQGDISRQTLGGFLRLFRKYKLMLEPPFRQRGLAYNGLCEAISKVNLYKQAKHHETTSKADATSFRALFLGSPSILTAVCSVP